MACKRPSFAGHNLIGGIPHVQRERKAVDEGLLEPCPERPTARVSARAEARGPTGATKPRAEAERGEAA